ncbi:hypothetical protein X798_02053 [Onchocerca flexuosa]|uniref:Uncharacterized protein n=1 Tax=Onchocerca flexuosa TaxID=387005 RepID=A0A238C0C6_9BILA|nr:hypothetical protein X798_02053 [Onchocerca flexuosa]
MSLGKSLLLFLLLTTSSVIVGQAPPGARVSTMVTKYMTPVITAQANFTYESHASNIEELKFVIPKETVKGLSKHPNVTFAIQITRKSCKAIKLCFGNKTNLFRHLDLLSKVKLTEANYNKKLSRQVNALVERSTYEVDACEGMTAIEWEFPKFWSWSNTSQTKGYMHYSALHQAGVPSTYRSKMSGLSNVETIILQNDVQSKPKKLGIEVRHGPTLFNVPVEETTPAFTTFYETFDLWSSSKELYFVLAQDANKCGARFSAPLTTHTFMKRDLIFNFRPGMVYRIRKGVNIWSIPIGFIVGTCVGVFGAGFLLCRNTKSFYKRWNAQMKKTYGKFATADVTTAGTEGTTVGGGVSQMTGASQIGDTTLGATSNVGGENHFVISAQEIRSDKNEKVENLLMSK